MGFETNKSSANKNQFVARLVSKKTGKTASWINLTDEFSRTVFGTELKDVTAEIAEPKLVAVFSNQFLDVIVKDLTAEIVTVEATEF